MNSSRRHGRFGVVLLVALEAFLSAAAPRVFAQTAASARPRISFRVHEVARPGGSSFGQTSAVDVDNDGDLDFISGRQGGDVFWFENAGNGRWRQHTIGQKAKTDVGGVAFDVDGDGWVDQVSGGTWFRNPGNPRESLQWERFENGAISAHDNLAADIDGDGKLDLVSILDKAGVFWYRIPADPTKTWIEHKVLGVTTPQCHGGLAVGDIDGDGDIDIARVDRWLENADGKGETWVERRTFDFGTIGPWGIQTRAALVDVDRDGDLDLVQAEGDVLDGRVAWFGNLDGTGRQWERHLIKSPGHNQDFHSLCVADFDNDGDVDIFSGGGPLTKGDHQWFLWENADGQGGQWIEHVVQRGLRTHESVCGDVDGDGDIDILTKPWRGDLHLFVENQLVSRTVFPKVDWQEATPESQGVDGTRLREAAELLARTVGQDGARELVVIRHGRMIWKGDDIDKRHGVWSATKSFTNTVLGLLIADGKCTLDTRAAEILPELQANYPDVTLRHFTTMTSGYRAVGDETTGSYKHGPSGTPFVPNPKPLFTPPGSQYAYWDSAMNTLGLVLTKIAGEPMEQLFQRRVAEPIGMKHWDWGDYATVDGVVVNGGSGNGNKHVFITARDMARFGLLFLNRGNWDGQQILPESWVADATRVHVPATTPWAQPESQIDGRGVYGCNWWRNGLKADGTRKFSAAPEGMFWASGHNNNKCFVIPEWDMVIVRLGLDGRAPDEVWNRFLEKVAEAVHHGSVPAR